MSIAFFLPPALALVCALAPVAADKPKVDPEDPTAVEKLVREFDHKHGSKKIAEKELAALTEAVGTKVPAFAPGGSGEDARLRSLRKVAKALTDDPRKAEVLAAKRAAKKSPTAPEARAFPESLEVAWRFGSHHLIALDEKNKELAGKLIKGEPVEIDDLTVANRLQALMKTSLPELDLVVAGIERELDVQRGADGFAVFLESWRNSGPNGEESFYQALDRTAGSTKLGVFFFDAMLSDYIDKLIKEKGIQWGLQERHDKLHQSFLTYRQYRAFIEAAALCFALPPDVPLPKRLERYDYTGVEGAQYSLRHMLDMLVEFNDGDVQPVIEELKEFITAHPMPADLWENYELMADYAATFQPRAKPMLVKLNLNKTNEIFERHKEKVVSLERAVRAAAVETLAP